MKWLKMIGMAIFVLIPLIILIFAGFIAILIIIFSDRWDLILPYIAPCITLLVGVGGIISANLIAAKWREQKKFDLVKDLTVDIVKQLNKIRRNLIDIKFLINTLEKPNTREEFDNVRLTQIKNFNLASEFEDLCSLLDVYSFATNQKEGLRLAKILRVLLGNCKLIKNEFFTTFIDKKTESKKIIFIDYNTPEFHLEKKYFLSTNAKTKSSVYTCDDVNYEEHISKTIIKFGDLKSEILKKSGILHS